MAGESVDLAAFFVQTNPPAALLNVIVLHLHAADGAEAGEGVTHERDNGTIAEAGRLTSQ